MAANTSLPTKGIIPTTTTSECSKTFSICVSDAQVDLGGNRTQQDFGFVFNGKYWTVAAIFDGHGNDGHSNAAGEAAMAMIQEEGFYEQLLCDPQTTADAIFDRMQQSNFDLLIERLQSKGIDYEIRDGNIFCPRNNILRGGTTATLVFADTSGLVTTMNAGDSDAWMYDDEKGTKLNAEHSAETPSEYDRLVACNYPRGYGSEVDTEGGAATKCVYDLAHFVRNPKLGVELSSAVVHGETPLVPYYVCNLDQKPATLVQVTDERGTTHKLAMSRSIGDENLRKGGVISTPEVSQHRVTDATVIKVASDGLWDAIETSKEHGATLSAVSEMGLDPNVLCEHWFKKTKKKSESVFGVRGSDNMWAYVMTLS